MRDHYSTDLAGAAHFAMDDALPAEGPSPDEYLDEPEHRECRECGTPFTSRVPDSGTKWTRLCDHCLIFEA